MARPSLWIGALAMLLSLAAPVGAAEKPSAPAVVPVKVIEANGRTRVVFQWRQKVNYEIAEHGGDWRVHFDRTAELDTAHVKSTAAALKPRVAKTARDVTISLAAPAGSVLQHWRSGSFVVIELEPAPGAAKAPGPSLAAIAPAAGPAAGAPVPLVPARAAAPKDAPAKDAAAKDAAAKDAAAKDAAAKDVLAKDAAAKDAAAKDAAAKDALAKDAATKDASAKDVATKDGATKGGAAKESPPSDKILAVRYAPLDDGARLRFDWANPVAAAVFRRGASIWVVFDAALPADLAEVKANGRAGVSAIEQLPHAAATVLRIATIQGFNPALSRVGNAWVLDLRPRPYYAEAPITIDVLPKTQRVLFRLQKAAAPITLTDPERGDTLTVVPGGELGQAVAREESFVDFRAVATVQGVVVLPLSDGVAARSLAEGVAIVREGGLSISAETERRTARTSLQRIFDFDAWGRQDLSYIERRRDLQNAVAAAPSGTRTVPRRDLARFYFTEGYGAETLSVLDAIERDDPDAMREPAMRGLRGAAAFLANDRELATKELGVRALDTEPEVALWRGALAAGAGDWPEAAKQFGKGIAVLTFYPKPLRHRFTLNAAEAMLNADSRDIAMLLLRRVVEDQPSPADLASARFLRGREQLLAGDVDAALATWDEVIATGDRRNKAHAGLAKTLALFDNGRLPRAETVQQLDALRFAWRGDQFEYTLLQRLGELQIKEGDFRGALDALHQAATNFPEYAPRGADKILSDAFADLFLGSEAESMPPMRALATFEEYHDLLPEGARGDEIIKKLADRLVAVDLLDRAAQLLDNQVKTRLAGREKARVATRLALVRLLDKKPALALEALAADVKEKEELPAELVQQRRILKGRALADLGKPSDALAALGPDTSREADRLRADIAWRSQNWPEAAKIFQRLAPGDGKLDDDAARLVVNWAAALGLSGDQAGLAELWQKYRSAMDATPSRDTFRVVAGQNGTASDLRAAASSIAQVSELQSFMAGMKQRLAGEKLSTIN